MTEEPDLTRTQQERDLYLGLLNLGAQEELEPFLDEALRLVVELTEAERGYLEIRDEHTGACYSMSRGCSDDQVNDIRGYISRGIIAEAIATGETIATASAFLDERFRERESVRARSIEAVLCAPVGQNAALGVVYLQGRTATMSFSPEDTQQAERLAEHLAPLASRLLARRRERETEDATRSLRERYRLGELVGRSRAFARALEQALLAAPVDVNVLLTGQSGTGKSQLARAIHDNSPRAAGPFVHLNCASIPVNLLESELFGAVKGSHSAAVRDSIGKVAAAEGGTLFLDEVAELPYEAQAKILHLLQSREYYPLGATTPLEADIRLIAATHVDLRKAVAEKRFREDLFYRLQVLPVQLPTLAERRSDVPELAKVLLVRAAERLGVSARSLSFAASHAIQEAEWPGNIRELENALEAAVVRAAGEGCEEIAVRHVFPESVGEEGHPAPVTFHEATRQFQRELLERILEETGWNVSAAARRLELARSHVYNLISALEITRKQTPQD